MSHLPPTAAIFSPSVARLASSTAKDWNYVDSWLSLKFSGRPPSFERNMDTLKVLVALAALNESADADCELIDALRSSSLETLDNGANPQRQVPALSSATPEAIVHGVVDAIADDLTREGRAAMDALASTSVDIGVAFPEPVALGSRIAEMQTRVYQLEQTLTRMHALQEYAEERASESNSQLKELEKSVYRPAAGLAKLNLELQRKVKTGTARLQDSRDRASGQDSVPKLTVQQLEEEEAAYTQLLEHKKNLDQQIKSFQGLPPDRKLAKKQLENLRRELNTATQKRDTAFEGLVEQATPKKTR